MAPLSFGVNVTDGKTIGGESTPAKISARERQKKALDFRLAGYSFTAIAEGLGYSGPSGAYKAVNTLLNKNIRQTADEVREIEVARLDRLFMTWWDKALEGDAAATDRVLAIMARRAKLQGLDAPLHIDIEVLIREAARQKGIDPDEAVREAAEIIRESRSRA